MATKLSPLSLDQLQQIADQSQAETGSWTWNPRRNPSQKDEEDDSWEVRAFAEDYTGSAAGSTWPPKSYSCSFCKREFRSAQALGGHMNVHRRDRASRRLHRSLPPRSATSTSTLIIPAQELTPSNGGLCLFYQLPYHNNYQSNGVLVPSANSISTMNVKSSGVEDLDLELRLGTGSH